MGVEVGRDAIEVRNALIVGTPLWTFCILLRRSKVHVYTTPDRSN